MEPGRYAFSEPFQSNYQKLMVEYENVQIQKANGTYQPNPVVDDPPTEKQLYALKRLGCETVPTSKKEASRMIGQMQKK